MSHHLVEAVRVSHDYPGGVHALRDVSFRITHGESVALVGANGAGKSTLLLALGGGLIPAAGEVRIGELPVTRETLPSVRRSVGLVLQDPDDQLFMPTVADDIAFGPRNLGLPEEEVSHRVAAALRQVGAEALAERPPYRLSGGEKRAVAIATVTALLPDVLVLDEPSSQLDPRSRRRLIELLGAFEHTKIIATHDLELAVELCSRTLALSQGELIADGQTREILAEPELLERCGLERPRSLTPCRSCGELPRTTA